MSNHPISVSLPISSFSGASHVPLIHVADGFGGITILEAALVAGGAGTAIGGILVTAADISATGGTPTINGTVGSFAGTVVTVVGGANLLTITDSYVDEDYWLAYDQASGTVPAGTYISLTYLHGK